MSITEDLQNKDDAEAYRLLQKLEEQSAESNSLYKDFDDFLRLLSSNKSYVRTRGFRLICAQAKWGKEDKIEANKERLLALLDDEKPTVVRQCLTALHQVVIEKPELGGEIQSKLQKMDLSTYKDSMRPLIQKDIDAIEKEIASLA